MKTLHTSIWACAFVSLIIIVIPFESSAQSPDRESLRKAIIESRDLIFQGSYDAALERLKEISQKYPESPAGDFHQAVALLWKSYVDARKLEKGEREFDAEIESRLAETIKKSEAIHAREDKSREDTIEALYYLGSAHGMRSQISLFQNHVIPAAREARTAQNYFDDLIELDPDYTDAYFASGNIYYQVGVLTESSIGKLAVTVLGANALPVGDRSRGLEYLKIAAERGPLTSVDAKLSLLEIYTFNEERFDEAAALARELQTKYPDNQTFRRYLLRAYAGMKDRAALTRVAQEIFARAKEGKPNFGSFIKIEAQRYMAEARRW